MAASNRDRFTLREGLIALILFVLVGAVLFLLPMTSEGKLAPTVLMLNNMKQLQAATAHMAMDSVARGDTNIGWPGDIGGSFTNWAAQLIDGKYLTTNDLVRLLSAPGKVEPPDKMPSRVHSAVLVYAVTGKSPANTVFLSSANFTNNPIGGVVDPTAKPFSHLRFVILRKKGDGAILPLRELGNTKRIGGFDPLCH